MKKNDVRKLSTDAQQEIRYQVIRLKKQGRLHKEISEITGIHRSSISKWWSLYKREGKKALKIKNRGPSVGSHRTLTSEQETILKKAMHDKCPDQLKLPFALWTRIAVQQLIKQLWSIEMPIRTVGEYLKRWGFTPKGLFVKLINRILKRSNSGSIKIIQPLLSVQKKKRPKSIGVTRPGYATIVTMAVVMHPVGKPRKLKFTPGVKG